MLRPENASTRDGRGRLHRVARALELFYVAGTHLVWTSEQGDRVIPALYADATKIEGELGWRAQRTDIARTISSAWRWFSTHPDGYDD